jgi:hypothetical protein
MASSFLVSLLQIGSPGFAPSVGDHMEEQIKTIYNNNIESESTSYRVI